jgi:hypothetical protein
LGGHLLDFLEKLPGKTHNGFVALKWQEKWEV